MKVWIDTEFNEYKGDLISIALCADDGIEFYEVLECPNPGPWVAEHVMPILNKQPIPMRMLQSKLSKFLLQYPEVTIIADWPEDIAHLCNLMIVGPGMRIYVPRITFQLDLSIEAVSALPHNALEDARAIRSAWASSQISGHP